MLTDEPAPVEQPTTITNSPTEGENPTEKRIKALSGKVESASKERDEALLKYETANKQVQFAESFVDIVMANPEAKGYKDQIKEKMMAGYSAQDATYAVLGPVGKLGNQQSMQQPIAGGSAPTVIPNNTGIKPINDMNREDLRGALVKAQEKGDFFLS